jgi:tetraacyldisaccharide-1-P 4'-kinase
LVQTKGPQSSRFPHARKLEWIIQTLPTGPVWLWTAIADPAELIAFYEKNGLRFKKVFTARDHACPDPALIRRLLDSAEADGAKLAITPKDSTKIDPELRDRCFILRRNPDGAAVFKDLFEGLQ